MAQVTSLYAALSALFVIGLALLVVQQRWRSRIGIGDGDDRVLQRRVRVHANALENLPLALLLMLLLELGGVPPVWLHACGIALLLARALHAWGLLHHAGASPGRFVGMLTTWGVMLAMALALLLRAL